MNTISLDRRFYELHANVEDGLAHSKYRAAMGLQNGLLGWPELLAKRRVVILAEAGSGKTAELTEQARLQKSVGKFSFYATVQNVGQDGLDKALCLKDRKQLNDWRELHRKECIHVTFVSHNYPAHLDVNGSKIMATAADDAEDLVANYHVLQDENGLVLKTSSEG